MKWKHPANFHRRATIANLFRKLGRLVRQAGRLTYPRLRALIAQRRGDEVEVGWALDGSWLHAARQLLVTLHPEGSEELMIASHPVAIKGASGTVRVPLPVAAPERLVARASAFNSLRQRSDPLETPVR
jgi:hypothetical protein